MINYEKQLVKIWATETSTVKKKSMKGGGAQRPRILQLCAKKKKKKKPGCLYTRVDNIAAAVRPVNVQPARLAV